MDSYDEHDNLNAALSAANEYPTNLLRTQSFPHDLEAYNKALEQQEQRLFVDDDPEYCGVKLLEAYDGGGKPTFDSYSLEALAIFTENS